MIAHDCDNMVKEWNVGNELAENEAEWNCFLANCTMDLGREVLGCIGECYEDSEWMGNKQLYAADALKDCAEDCENSNGVQGIQATQFTMLLVTVFAMFMVAKILFKWRINSF